MHVWDLRLGGEGAARLDLPDGWNTMLVVLHGTLQINDPGVAREGQLVLLSANGEDVVVESSSDPIVLVLSGQPIDEPIVGHGPFVMNTREQISQAIRDFSSGRFGRL